MLKLSSTYQLYQKIAAGEIKGFIVPAFNLRMLTFFTARALFRAVKKEEAGAFIIEIAPTESEYTRQSLREYKKTILKAAQEENFEGILFLQVDHLRLNGENDLNKAKRKIKKSIKEGFYNIDIDGSSLPWQENARLTAELVKYIRQIQPPEITISIGGEVGAIGGEKTKIEEFRRFMEKLEALAGKSSLIKIAVQTGTSHGGIMLPSGVLKKVEEDFKLLEKISLEAKKYGLAGAVQHGASTLPEDYFYRFAKTGACEIHLATIFQNIVYDSPYFPDDLRQKIYRWLKQKYKNEMKEDEKEIQFLYRLRKKALGRFKKKINKIPLEDVNKICEELEEKFTFFIKSLNVSRTAGLIKEIYHFS